MFEQRVHTVEGNGYRIVVGLRVECDPGRERHALHRAGKLIDAIRGVA